MNKLEIEREKNIEKDEKPKQDNMFRAIFFMNFSGLFSVCQSSFWKYVQAKYGFEFVDYWLIRNSFLALVSMVIMQFSGIVLFDYPEEKSKNDWLILLTARSLLGHACFFFFNTSFKFAPVSLCIIIFQTYPFWASILGYFVNGEIIEHFEIVGILFSFLGICTLGLVDYREKQQT